MSLGRWQPDIVCISLAKKKIAIGPEVSLPSYSRIAALQEAHSRKTQSYGPLITALEAYVDPPMDGWSPRHGQDRTTDTCSSSLKFLNRNGLES